jgi:hypothetical protein
MCFPQSSWRQDVVCCLLPFTVQNNCVSLRAFNPVTSLSVVITMSLAGHEDDGRQAPVEDAVIVERDSSG